MSSDIKHNAEGYKDSTSSTSWSLQVLDSATGLSLCISRVEGGMSK